MTNIEAIEFAISELNILAENTLSTFEYNKIRLATEKLENVCKIMVDKTTESV
jgi:hypothetical protein